MRVLKREKTARKADVDSQALALQDRLEREMGFEDDAPAEEEAQGEVSSSGKYIIKRKTEFYGLGSENWLNLVIKVGQVFSPSIGCTDDRLVLLCADGQE